MNIELLGQEPQDDDAICAARYRWLKAGRRMRQGEPLPNVVARCIDHNSLRAALDFSFFGSPDQLDSAIDQAMKETP